jgi:predicted phage terminase large subunit-like protein
LATYRAMVSGAPRRKSDYGQTSHQPRDRMVISWDIALSESQTGDSSAGVVLLNRGDKFYVLEVAKGQFPFGQLISKILDMSRRYLGSTLLIEESPISLGLIQELRENNINVVTVKPTKDKQSRVISQSGLIEGGSVLFPQRAPWLDAFISELLSFPGGRHDDQVDALVQGLAYQRGQWLRRHNRATQIRLRLFSISRSRRKLRPITVRRL